ncbi:aromatic-ring-hydroxylating dioxygenase subunit beta [Halopenitus sp. POP-27]|uniref:aromatic-ring-hydroxylating dioxygenase subunit beta n=1 Tax=Halopenitus sp. POP-27 TaxID=2994425 RepID=UPI002469298D|nr:aromatic-ring-hydroxylating dioxygenase subunit beta [Halopenitus sp. POP-27]
MSDAIDGVDADELRELVLERDLRNFYTREADLLDNRDLDEWFDLIEEGIQYRMPRRLMKEYEPAEFDDEAHFFDEDYGSLKARVERFDSSYAWAERPPARVRRYVTNVTLQEWTEETVSATSNVLLYYSQGDTTDYSLLSIRREDTLGRTEDGFTIAQRTILPDHTTLGISKISTFL